MSLAALLLATAAIIVSGVAYRLARKALRARRRPRPERDQLTESEQKERFAAMGEKREAEKDHDFVRQQRVKSGETLAPDIERHEG